MTYNMAEDAPQVSAVAPDHLPALVPQSLKIFRPSAENRLQCAGWMARIAPSGC
jgi:hypothetical protein